MMFVKLVIRYLLQFFLNAGYVLLMLTWNCLFLALNVNVQ